LNISRIFLTEEALLQNLYDQEDLIHKQKEKKRAVIVPLRWTLLGYHYDSLGAVRIPGT
jgi:hypothetical protein